ncbi:hypothetical protein EDD86DRAFT_15901 [Gorgonomyces haynaldii]|nr:hypothetical protein EDD86DRAFT_15901 [Gorgonomyces haynaldii]
MDDTTEREAVFSDDKPKARNILVPIDGSVPSEESLKWALANIIRKETDTVLLAHVRPKTKNEQDKLASHQLLINKCHQMQELGISVRGVALAGDAKKVLLEEITNSKPEMVVIGSRGLGAVQAAFLGSVSQHLIQHTDVPIVLTRPTKEK